MNRLFVYFILYILLLSLIAIYFDNVAIRGIEITKSHFMVISLVIPFLILIQWSFETVFNTPTTTTKSIVGKVLGILLGTGVAFTILFYMLKFVSSYIFTQTFLLSITGVILLSMLLSISKTREAIKTLWLMASTYIGKLYSSNTGGTPLTSSQKKTLMVTVLVIVTLVLAREYRPLLKSILLPRHRTLLESPVYLQNEKHIGTTEHVNMKHISEAERNADKSINNDIQLDINYNYALSFLVYLNPQGRNTRVAYNTFTKILDFGENPTFYFNSKTRQLKLEFYIEDDVKKDILIQLDDEDDIVYQKWNSFVFNVKGGDLDVFLNGKVIHHQQITNKYKIDKITTGNERGLAGGIKNIMFFSKPLRLYQIHLLNYTQ